MFSLPKLPVRQSIILRQSSCCLPGLFDVYGMSCFKRHKAQPKSMSAGQKGFALRDYLNASPPTKKTEVIKSPNDKKSYRAITLKNGLNALLISDALAAALHDDNICESDSDFTDSGSSSYSSDEEDELSDSQGQNGDIDADGKQVRKKSFRGLKLSAAALAIGVGSFSDPVAVPGLAHFLEHMVFMGSKKYEDENSFDAFVKSNGGSTNASTDCELTVFQFDLYHKALREGLDRFAQFFISPLLKQDSVDREVSSVDSEFDSSKNSDAFRVQQLLSKLAVSGHPMGKFMWGNQASLKDQPLSQGVDMYKQLQEFHRRWYSAHYMTLAVQSQDSLDDLEKMVRDTFSEIANNKLPPPDFSQLKQPFHTDEFKMLFKVVPVKKKYELKITWDLPPQHQNYRSKPLHYLSCLVGHEGKGSLLAYLKNKLLALELTCGNDESGYEHSTTHALFIVNISLTEAGLKAIHEVLSVVFEYLEMLKQEGPKEWLYNEMKRIDDTSFLFAEDKDPIETVEDLATNMHFFPVEHFITGDKLFYEYSPQAIDENLRLLTPDRMNVMLLSKTFDDICDLKEPWYETCYHQEDFAAEWLDKWTHIKPRPELHLPAPNKYIAEDFNIKQPDCELTKYPVRITDGKRSRLWYKKDTKFKIPKGYIQFILASNIVNKTPLHYTCLALLIKILDYNLSEISYDAYVANLSYSLKGCSAGLQLRVSGYNDKLPALFQTVVDSMADFQCSQELFAAIKDQLRRAYYNFMVKPSRLCRELRLTLLEHVHWMPTELLSVLEDITVEVLMSFLHDFKSTLYIEGLVHGNFTSEEAHTFEAMLKEKLCSSPILPSIVYPETRIVALPEEDRTLAVENFGMADGDVNTVVTNYYQQGPGDLRSLCEVELLNHYMEEPCFDCLRSKEQLGYDVYNQYTYTSGIIGFLLCIETQAEKYSAEYVDTRMENFLSTFRQTLDDASTTDFQKIRKSLIVLKETDDSNMGEEVSRNWEQIMSRNYMFDRLDREVDCLKTLTKDDLINRLSAMMSDHKKKISVQVICLAAGDRVSKMHTEEKRNLAHVEHKLDAPNESESVEKVDSELIPELEKASISPALLNTNLRVLTPDKDIKNYITDITAFKRSLYVYPITKITT